MRRSSSIVSSILHPSSCIMLSARSATSIDSRSAHRQSILERRQSMEDVCERYASSHYCSTWLSSTGSNFLILPSFKLYPHTRPFPFHTASSGSYFGLRPLRLGLVRAVADETTDAIAYLWKARYKTRDYTSILSPSADSLRLLSLDPIYQHYLTLFV